MEKERHGILEAATNPAAVFEVLSPTTERYDRYHKRDSHQSMATVQEVVFISIENYRVERYVRVEDGWRFEATIGVGAVARIFDIDIPLAELYEDIELPVEPGE